MKLAKLLEMLTEMSNAHPKVANMEVYLCAEDGSPEMSFGLTIEEQNEDIAEPHIVLWGTK